jgi:hypothetical protein
LRKSYGFIEFRSGSVLEPSVLTSLPQADQKALEVQWGKGWPVVTELGEKVPETGCFPPVVSEAA